MKFKVTIYKADHTESWVDLHPYYYYELQRQLEKCEIEGFKVEVL